MNQTRMRWSLISLLTWFACGAVIFVLASNFWILWGLWLVAFGIILGKIFSARARLPEISCGIIVAFIIGVVAWRALPIHSLDWDEYSQITITRLGENWQIEITDPSEIDIFKSYARRGHYETMTKSGYGYHVYVGDKNSSKGFYIHGAAIGDRPGGFIQDIFVPQKDGFREDFEAILKKHGHEIK